MVDLVECIKKAKGTTMKFATMFVVSRLLAGGALDDQAWIKQCVLTLVGFAAYDCLVSIWLNADNISGMWKSIAATWMKVGTMMVVSRLLAGGDIMDRQWQKECLFVLLGFNAASLLTDKVINLDRFSGKTKDVISTTVNVGTMHIVARLLAGGDLQDEAWLKGVAYELVGFAVYDGFVAGLV